MIKTNTKYITRYSFRFFSHQQICPSGTRNEKNRMNPQEANSTFRTQLKVLSVGRIGQYETQTPFSIYNSLITISRTRNSRFIDSVGQNSYSSRVLSASSSSNSDSTSTKKASFFEKYELPMVGKNFYSEKVTLLKIKAMRYINTLTATKVHRKDALSLERLWDLMTGSVLNKLTK